MSHTVLARKLLSHPVIKKTNWTKKSSYNLTQVEYMAIWVRDRFHCVYCNRDMLKSYDTHYWGYAIDHLLPRKYTELLPVQWNLVLSCDGCNGLKGGFDPRDSLTPSEDNRERFLTNARAYITAKRDAATKHFELEKAAIRVALQEDSINDDDIGIANVPAIGGRHVW